MSTNWKYNEWTSAAAKRLRWSGNLKTLRISALVLAFGLLTGVLSSAMAEGKGDGKDSGLLTVDRIYKKKEFKSKSFSASSASSGGSGNWAAWKNGEVSEGEEEMGCEKEDGV